MEESDAMGGARSLSHSDPSSSCSTEVQLDLCWRGVATVDSNQQGVGKVHSHTDPGSIHSTEFSVLKHRADLLYYQQQYRKALELYGRLLPAVPETTVCVTREIRDAIARCQLKLGNGDQARKEAERMVRNIALGKCSSVYCFSLAGSSPS